MTIKEDVVKPAPKAEEMEDRREEATITTEVTESTAPTTIVGGDKMNTAPKAGHHATQKVDPGLNRPLTTNEDLCCRTCWEGCVHCCCIYPCAVCCCGEG